MTPPKVLRRRGGFGEPGASKKLCASSTLLRRNSKAVPCHCRLAGWWRRCEPDCVPYSAIPTRLDPELFDCLDGRPHPHGAVDGCAQGNGNRWRCSAPSGPWRRHRTGFDRWSNARRRTAAHRRKQRQPESGCGAGGGSSGSSTHRSRAQRRVVGIHRQRLSRRRSAVTSPTWASRRRSR